MTGMRLAIGGAIATCLVAGGLYLGLREAGRKAGAPRPDLRFASFVSADPMFPEPGAAASLLFVLANDGMGDVPGGIDVVAYASDPRTGDPGAPVFSGRIDESIPAGETRTTSLPWQAPDRPGEFQWYFVLDPKERLSEETRDNNVVLSALTIAAARPPQPDLALEELRYEPAAPSAGRDFTVVATVVNRGSAATGQPVTLDFYVNDPIGPQPRLPGQHRVRVPPLEPNARHEAQVRLLFDKPRLVGVHAQVDTDEEAQDLDRSNNVTGPAIVAVGSAEQSGHADLVIESIELDPPSPTLGSQAVLRVRVANRGTADTPNQFSVDVSFGPETTLPGFANTGEPEQHSLDLRFLAAGDSFALPGIPVSFNVGGTWSFRAVADPYHEIDEGVEGGENNNEASLEARVIPKP